jgi:hypothetical protein
MSEQKDSTAQRLLWSDASPAQRQAVKDDFIIPQQAHLEILPAPILPIAKMLEYPLPLEAPTNDSSQPAQFFSKRAPDASAF